MLSERPNVWAALLTFCLVAFAASMWATAQDTESASVPMPQAPSSDSAAPEFQGGKAAPVPQTPLGDGDERVQYVGPDTYILRDAQGRLQSMPGMTYEDFLAAWKRLQQVDEAERRPRYAIDRVVFKGRAQDRHAELQCEITVRFLTEGPVDVPLGMAEAILQGEARFTTAATGEKSEGDQDQAKSDGAQGDYLDYDPQRGGFVARFAAGSNQSRTVTLSLLVPLLRDAAGNSLSLTCPRTASSSLTLDVDAAVTEADVTSGVITAQETTPNGTHLVVAGAMGPFRLTWRTPEAAGGAFATVLNSQGASPCCHRRAKCAHQRTPHRAKLRWQLRPPACAVAAGCAVDPGPGNSERRRKPRLPRFPRAVAARCRSAKRRCSPPGCVGGIPGQAAWTRGYRFGNRTADRFGERLDGGARRHGSFGRRSPIRRCRLAGCA